MTTTNNFYSRRRILSLAAAASAAALSSACAGTQPIVAQDQEGNGVLQFWSNHPGSSREIEQQLVAAWNQENPQHPAELIDGGSNYAELAQKI